MIREFDIIGTFNVGSEPWVSVKLYETGGILTMPVDDWRKVYGKRHPEKCGK